MELQQCRRAGKIRYECQGVRCFKRKVNHEKVSHSLFFLAVALPLFPVILSNHNGVSDILDFFMFSSLPVAAILWVWACVHFVIHYHLPKWSIIFSLLYVPGLILYVLWGRSVTQSKVTNEIRYRAHDPDWMR